MNESKKYKKKIFLIFNQELMSYLLLLNNRRQKMGLEDENFDA